MGIRSVARLASVFAVVASATLLTSSQAVAVAMLFGAAHDGPNGAASLYTIDTSNGAASLVGAIGFERVGGLDFHPVTGVLYATGERTDGSNVPVLLTIDKATGVGTEIAALNGGLPHSFGDPFDTRHGSPYTDISFRNADSALYAYLEGRDGVGVIDIGTGALTELGGSGANCCGNGIGFSAADVLFHANDVNLNTLDQTTGAATPVAPLTKPVDNVFGRINSLDTDPDSGVMYAALNSTLGNSLATLDTTTGVITEIGPSVEGLSAIAFVSAPVPEPGAAGLFGLGLLAVHARLRRRARRS